MIAIKTAIHHGPNEVDLGIYSLLIYLEQLSEPIPDIKIIGIQSKKYLKRNCLIKEKQ